MITWVDFIESVTPLGATCLERVSISRGVERLIKKEGRIVGDIVYWWTDGYTLYDELFSNGWVTDLELTPPILRLFESEHLFRRNQAIGKA